MKIITVNRDIPITYVIATLDEKSGEVDYRDNGLPNHHKDEVKLKIVRLINNNAKESPSENLMLLPLKDLMIRLVKLLRKDHCIQVDETDQYHHIIQLNDF